MIVLKREKLKEIMALKKKSHRSLAKGIGESARTVYYNFRYGKRIRPELALKIAKFLEVEPSEIVEREGFRNNK
jgi:DNA-binding Xre family transcriptional regulator